MPIPGEEYQSERRTPSDTAALWRQLVINQQEVIALQRNQLAFQKDVAEKLSAIENILSQAKGGWKVFLAIGTATSVILGGVGWVLVNVLHIKF